MNQNANQDNIGDSFKVNSFGAGDIFINNQIIQKGESDNNSDK